MKIVIVGLMNDTNVGDEVISNTLVKLLRRMEDNEQNSNSWINVRYESWRRNISSLSLLLDWGKKRGGEKENSITYEALDLYGRKERCEDSTTLIQMDRLEFSVNCKWIQRFFIKCFSILENRFKISGVGKHFIWYCNFNNKKRLQKYYYSKMCDASLLIFAGGGIIECSNNHDYYHHIDLITKMADKMNIPVCFNAVGKVVDSKHMFGWNIMKKALNRKCIKSITCRDGHDWMNDFFFEGRQVVSIEPCCAISTSEAYGIKKNKNSNIIGIGVIRGNIFTSYGKKFDEKDLLNLYCEIVKNLNNKGYYCNIFTNGYSEDFIFANKLIKKIERLGIEISLLERPSSAEMLIRQIANFKGIITARLHSCIVAYSLQIPTVAISWNSKVKDFMELIKKPDCAVEINVLKAEYIIEVFEKQLSIGYNQYRFQELQDRVKFEIKKISSYIKEV